MHRIPAGHRAAPFRLLDVHVKSHAGLAHHPGRHAHSQQIVILRPPGVCTCTRPAAASLRAPPSVHTKSPSPATLRPPALKPFQRPRIIERPHLVRLAVPDPQLHLVLARSIRQVLPPQRRPLDETQTAESRQNVTQVARPPVLIWCGPFPLRISNARIRHAAALLGVVDAFTNRPFAGNPAASAFLDRRNQHG